MPEAISLGIREQIIKAKSEGKTLKEIALEKKMSYSTVINICRLHQRGESLVPKYHNCGPTGPKYSALIYRACLWLKRRHADWGAPFILLKLEERYPDEALPSPRTVQRWFSKAKLNKKKSKIPQGSRVWAKEVHETWQLDAKEQFILKDGQKACYLTVIDEKSGSALGAQAFPPVPYQ